MLGMLGIPTSLEKTSICKAFLKDLESYTIVDEGSNTFKPVICCVCDSMPTEPHWHCFVDVSEAVQLFTAGKLQQKWIEDDYGPSKVLKDYTISDGRLNQFVLSSATYINGNDEILMCKQCYGDLSSNLNKKKKKGHAHLDSPKDSICNGYLIGDPPVELIDLNEVELSLVSRGRIYCQSWIFFAGCHQHIKGWHTFFRNRPADNVGNLMQLTDAGVKGIILVALCGPFTSTQKAIALKKTAVDPRKVVKAWQWLKENNIRYKNDKIPNIDSIPLPVVLAENLNTVESENVDIENQMNMTVLFPDSSLPEPTNGGFSTQEEFRKFVTGNQTGHWSSELHSRPLSERMADYKDETVADAFPLQFPYGYTGLQGDPAVQKMKKRNGKQVRRDRNSVFRKYLQHRKSAFHRPMFNLIIQNLLMKESIFSKTQMFCNIKAKDGHPMGEKYGQMGAKALERAIHDTRNNLPIQHSSSPEHQFLKSIRASCGDLPHSNEATQNARKDFFSYLMLFGLPAIFLTISPDDLRNFRIVVYSLVGVENTSGVYNVEDFTDQQIVDDFTIRSNARLDYPGLCAEEYERIVDLVIKHLFNWDVKKEKCCGVGLFAEIQAWTLATEEQGRKSLHGHFLLFVKNWKMILTLLQCRKADKKLRPDQLTFSDAVGETKRFYKNACSARLFADFPPYGEMGETPAFFHEGCRSKRRGDVMRYSVKPAPDQNFREMRHKVLCHAHLGKIATCEKCQKVFSVEEIVQRALNVHFGKIDKMFSFPDGVVKRLDRLVYELQKDFQWVDNEDYQVQSRYFACNALVNVHLTRHTNRCFKKGPECYANLPDIISDTAKIIFNDEADIWSDWKGTKEHRHMFICKPKRMIEDAFMNTHNQEITSLLGCNNNVLLGMDGPIVYYVTGYNTKSQQKEERKAYEKVSEMLIKTLRNQEEANHQMPEHQLGFRRILAGIYTHTSGHIVAAPMAHYLAKHQTRFKYSHERSYVPVQGIERMLNNESTLMRFRKKGGKQVAFHRGMNYLHRPKALEDMCLYQFFREMVFLTRKKAEEDGIEFFEFTEDHPFHKTDVLAYANKELVPSFPWNWLDSTLGFRTTILDPADKNHGDYKKKEEYCFRFMILFMKCREKDDLLLEGSCQKQLQKAYKEGLISDESIEIADNIQTVHNSLKSTIPPDSLIYETELTEAEDIDENQQREDDGFDDFLASIGELFATTGSNTTPMTEDATILNPSFSGKSFSEERFKVDPPPKEDLNCVIQFRDTVESKRNKRGECNDVPWFTTKTSELNSLAMQQWMIDKSDGGQSEESNGRESVPERKKTVDNVDATGSWQSIVAWGESAKLDAEQQTAFEILAATYVLTFYDEAENDMDDITFPGFRENKQNLCHLGRRQMIVHGPLRMFVTGPAGAGKSTILNQLLAYAKMFSQNIGHHFTKTTIRVTALTGAAATEIGGRTAACDFQYMNRAKTSATQADLNSFADTRMNIIDEISFADYDTVLGKISANLQAFTQCHEYQFGKHAICFLGDFCQLEAIGGNSIYKHRHGIYWEQSLNCMVELKGTHRYSKCPQMMRIMPELRENGLSEENRKILNSRVIDGKEVKMPSPATTRFATYFNDKHAKINADVFKDYLEQYHGNCTENDICDTAIVIKANASWGAQSKNLTFEQRKILFEDCSEGDIKNKDLKRCDPLLCLFRGCNLMGIENTDVEKGIANGTTCTFQQVMIKSGVQLTPIQMYGKWVNSVCIEDVEYMELSWQGLDRFKGTFRVHPHKATYSVDFPISELGKTVRVQTRIQMEQFPVVLNHATTGHKLQGKTLDSLVIAQWSTVKNWAYVVLSRVRTLDGLFFTKPIPENIDFRPAAEYLDMMQDLRDTILATPDQVTELKSTLVP